MRNALIDVPSLAFPSSIHCMMFERKGQPLSYGDLQFLLRPRFPSRVRGSPRRSPSFADDRNEKNILRAALHDGTDEAESRSLSDLVLLTGVRRTRG